MDSNREEQAHIPDRVSIGHAICFWEIGIVVLTSNSDFDRTSRGFTLSGPTPFEHGRIAKTPGNLTYIVGESKPSDWYFGQSNLGTWSVKFNLESLPETSTSAKLYTSLAGFSSGTKSNILVNDQKIGNISSNAVLLVSSQDTYRGATQAGEWRNLQWDIKKELLKVGENKVDIKVTESTKWRGWLWDSLVLEWV